MLQKKVVEIYKQLFHLDKDYFSIIKEVHNRLKSLKDLTFAIHDFKSEKDYLKNISIIEDYRKYTILDSIIMNMEENPMSSLIKVSSDFRDLITYHEIVEAIEIFQENFPTLERFYIRKEITNVSQELKIFKVLTTDDIFNNFETNQFKLYFIETEKSYIFGVYIEGYEYLYRLPSSMNNISFNLEEESSRIAYGYLYLIQNYVNGNYRSIKKEKEYTTIRRVFGLTYEDYIKTYGKLENESYVYNNNVKPFLIENEEVKYKYDLIKAKDFGVVDLLGNKGNQHEDFLKYFETLEVDTPKVNSYLEENWIKKNDIGKNYSSLINYNIVATKEELEQYKEEIIKEKFFDITHNIFLFKKYGVFKFSVLKNDKPLDISSVFLNLIKEDLEKHITTRKDFNSNVDRRINLDTNNVFKLGTRLNKAFEHSNNRINKNVFGVQESTEIFLEVDLVQFLLENNEGEISPELEKLFLQWYFPYLQLKHYIENPAQPFGQVTMISSVKSETFEFMKDKSYFTPEGIVKAMRHPNMKKHYNNYLLGGRNDYYFEHAMIIDIPVGKKDYEKIQKGTHPLFKSIKLEQDYREKEIQLLNSPRMLKKNEVKEKEDYNVIYTRFSNERLGLYKGMQGRIIEFDKKIIIEDEFGKVHEIAIRNMQVSGWVHLSTLNHKSFYDTLKITEKSFLKENSKLITQQLLQLEN